jgi:putative ABC transport system substrate-binding protein
MLSLWLGRLMPFDRVRRREFITLIGGAAAWPLAARAQQAGKKMLRVGTVSALPQSSPTWAAFRRRMAELGYQEGKTFVFDLVSAANEDDYETGYRTLAAREPDIIMATGPESALKSALAVTRTLPIVMIAIDYDPFARGYVTNLARPSKQCYRRSFPTDRTGSKADSAHQGCLSGQAGRDHVLGPLVRRSMASGAERCHHAGLAAFWD